MFAGPNGSGKSTFIKAIQQECSIGFILMQMILSIY